MVTAREMWMAFCEKTLDSNSDDNKKFMISFSSAIFDTLLREVHARVAQISMAASSITVSQGDDDDDVYFRFAGATLASMLHNRYNDIRKCSKERRDIVSKEIKVLQINTKDKSDMPNYLKYRDKGHMYSPDPVFIPFFRSVDECIKSVVNEKGIEDHGNQLIKVYIDTINIHYYCALSYHRLHICLPLKQHI